MRLQLFLRRSFFFFVRSRGWKVISKQPAAHCFPKTVRLRPTAHQADVEQLAFSAMKRLKNFVDGFGEPEAARKIVRRAKRENRQRNSAVHYFPRRFVHRAIPS